MVSQAVTHNAAALSTEIQLRLDPSIIFERAGFCPDEWQRDLIEGASGVHGPKRYLVCASRGAGKSEAAACAALARAVTRDKSLTVFTAPSIDQSVENIRRVVELVEAAGFRGDVKSDGKCALEFWNGSRVVALQGSREASTRGRRISLLIADELAGIDEAVIVSLFPSLATVPDACFLGISTPRGMHNWFADQWHAENGWDKIQVSADQCARIDAEFLHDQRKVLGDVLWRQEYMLDFGVEGEGIFTRELIESKAVRAGSFW